MLSPKEEDLLFISAQPEGFHERHGLENPTRALEELAGKVNGKRIRVINALKGMPGSVPEGQIIISGSVRSSYEKESWIEDLKEFVRKMDSRRKAILGICFGMHVINDAFGGKVVRGEEGEMGSARIHLTQEGSLDPLFDGLSEQFELYTNHGDYVRQLPTGARSLAHNGKGIQAFAIGDNIRAIQAHPETERHHFEALFKAKQKHWNLADQDLELILESMAGAKVGENGKQILRNFIQNIGPSRQMFSI